MRALQLLSPRTEGPWLTVEERESPQPGPDQVAVAVHACGVCRTDLQLVTGDLVSRKLPIVPGHQVVGEITAIGDAVPAERLGTQVGLAWLGSACGACRFCQSGRENLCLEAHFTGWDLDGGYATEVLARNDYAFDLSHLLGPTSGRIRTPLDVAPLLCGGVIGYRALRVAGVSAASSGLRLGLYGYGASARIAQQVAHIWGVHTYVTSRSAAETDAALRAGARWAGTYDERPPVPLDAAITFAPVGSVVVAALRSLDRGGVVAINAIHLDEIPRLDYGDLWWERSVRSVANVTRADVREFLDIAGEADIATEFETMPLAEANQALTRLAAGDVNGSFVLDCTTLDSDSESQTGMDR